MSARQVAEIERQAIQAYSGDWNVLEAALGMLRMGALFGWKGIRIVHSKRTIRRYEQILGIEVKALFPEEGPESYRLSGLTEAKLHNQFWKAVGGDIKLKDRKLIEASRGDKLTVSFINPV